MVMIFNEAESSTIPLEDLVKMTPAEVILKITNNNPPDPFLFLSKCGVRIPDNITLASAKLVDQDFLRIVRQETSIRVVTVPKSGRDLLAATRDERNRSIENLRKKCQERYKELTQVEANRVYYMEVLNILTDPDFFQKQLVKYPHLAKHPAVCSYVADPLMCFAVLKEGDKLTKLKNANFCFEHPVILEIIKDVLALENFRPVKKGPTTAQVEAAARAARLQQAPAAAGPSNTGITAEMLQNAISFAMGNVPAAAPQNAPAPPPAAPPVDILAPYRQRYAEQLQQLREFGFANDQQNLEVLVQCEGNVATAMEILIDEANPHQ